MVEEEVVQFVGPDQVLGLLGDLSVGIGRQQFGADGRRHDVEQRRARRFVPLRVGHPPHQMAHEGLRHRGVHTVHRHLVAVVGGPAQGQFRQVSRADDQSALHVGHVHEDLRPFAGLRVFVGGRAVRGVEPDVPEVLHAGLADRDLALRDSQFAHQFQGVAVGSVGGSEARHRDADDAPAVEPQLVERAGGDQQGKRRVQSARDADDGLRATGVRKPAGQSVRLDLEDLLAALVAAPLLMRNKRHGVDVAVDPVRAHAFGDLHLDDGVLHVGFVEPEGGVAPAFEGQPFEVHVGCYELLVERETFAFAQDHAVLGDQGVAGEDQVGRGFAEAGRAVDVGRDRAARLLGDELPQVVVLADRLGRGREVEDHAGAVLRRVRRGRHGGPEVLAEFDAELRAVHGKREVRAEVGLLPRHVDLLLRDSGPGGEPAGFVELRVARDVGFGHHAEDAPLREDDGTVVERLAVAQRRPDDCDEGQLAG